jgi:cytochrome c oxidase subunit 2
MNTEFQLWPEQASTYAQALDPLMIFMLVFSSVITLVVFALVVYLSLKYRRRNPDERPAPVQEPHWLENAFAAGMLVAVMVMFFWGARVYFVAFKEAPDALDIHVIGKQWMWKVQHPNGTREINALHVPRGQRIQITLASQDVIHSFFIPAFRVKQDAVPGRYTKMVFEPTKVGEYHLFCAEYCGAQHSGMIGRVYVMEPEKYQEWMAGTVSDVSPAESGARLFQQRGCITCHGVQAPSLAGIFGREQDVVLPNGRTQRVVADEAYLRESILDSGAKVVAGYQPIMPSFRGQLNEEQLIQLVTYIKSLRGAQGGGPAATQQSDGVRVPDKSPATPGPANQTPRD